MRSKPAFIRDVQREVPELFELVQNGRRKLLHRHFGKLLNEGRKAGTIRKDIPTDILIANPCRSGGCDHNPARLSALGLTLRTGFTQIISVFLEGVLVRKGAGAMIKMFRIFERGGRFACRRSALLCGLLVSCKPAEEPARAGIRGR
jgi:hypothetical protein